MVIKFPAICNEKIMFLRDPSAYHGEKNKRPFFEGWYHKLVTSDDQSLVIIPGIYRSGENNNQTAFIMIFDGISGDLFYEKFEVNQFNCSTSSYDLQIGSNYFSPKRIIIDIDSKDLIINGKITADNLKPWPVTLFEPGCMGWYAYIPTMECFHGILSMNHSLSGKLMLNDSTYNFSNGRGYIEKAGGRNFPKDWIWAQANHFSKTDASITASLATIPWKKRTFAGFIVGFYYENNFLRFTTYRNSMIKDIHYDLTTLYWEIERGDLKLELTIEKGGKTGLLYAPDVHDMIPKVDESLDGKIQCQLYNKNEKIFDDTSILCATEFIGDTNKLIEMALN